MSWWPSRALIKFSADHDLSTCALHRYQGICAVDAALPPDGQSRFAGLHSPIAAVAQRYLQRAGDGKDDPFRSVSGCCCVGRFSFSHSRDSIQPRPFGCDDWSARGRQSQAVKTPSLSFTVFVQSDDGKITEPGSTHFRESQPYNASLQLAFSAISRYQSSLFLPL